MRISILFFFTCYLLPALSFAQKPLYKKVAEQWAYIPSGNLTLFKKDTTTQKSGRKMQKDTVSIAAFWISKTEISNGEYLAFIESLKAAGDTAKLRLALPDTNVWRFGESYNEPYVSYYFRHPAYRDYPVVGITQTSAMLYCEWLTEKYNTLLKELFPKLEAKEIRVQLPNLKQWIYAAKGGLEISPYPWGGPYIQNAHGDYMANFRKIGDASITWNPSLRSAEIIPNKPNLYYSNNHVHPFSDITAPVKCYCPNNYKLYAMSGNVAEWVSEKGIAKGGSWFTCGYDAQIEAPDPFAGDTNPKAFVGFRPIFLVIK